MLTLRIDNRFSPDDPHREKKFEDAAALCEFLRLHPVMEGNDRYILTGLDLSGQSLKGAYLQNVLMFECNLQNVDLSGADLRNAGVIQTDFSGANMTNTVLIQTNLTAAKLRGTDLTGSVMAATVGSDADFTGAKLVDCKIGSSGFDRGIWDGADLTGVEFGNGVRFDHASMQNTNFTGASAKARIGGLDVDFSGAKVPANIRAMLDGPMRAAPNMDAASLRRQKNRNRNRGLKHHGFKT